MYTFVSAKWRFEMSSSGNKPKKILPNSTFEHCIYLGKWIELIDFILN